MYLIQGAAEAVHVRARKHGGVADFVEGEQLVCDVGLYMCDVTHERM